MIYGKPEPTDIMSALSASCDWVFYPTGSRYFTPTLVRESTDWDFFAQNSPELHQWLLNRGFQLLGVGGYIDSNTEMVMRHPYLATHIDVQLVKNVDLKFQAQNLLHDLGILGMVREKRSRTVLWNRALMFCSKQMNEMSDLA